MELKEYLQIIKKRLWLIAIVVLVSTITTIFFSYVNNVPIYQASTKLIVNKTVELDQMGKEQMDFGAMAINIRLIDTYKEIINTPAIMDKVVMRYPDLQLTPEQLASIVNVSAFNGTQVMTLSVMDTSYARAVKIVNAVSEVFQTEIPKIMKVDNVTILNPAKLTDAPKPLNSKANQYVIISFAVSLLFGIGIAFLLEYLNDTIKREEDIQKIFGAPMLSTIPIMKKSELKSSGRAVTPRKVGEYAKGSI
ncbi:YveK family protein [Paenibacillus hamazuiensis]|uniref:YveK family protein n=1 Tax=Paenibacillus hamazuiensis TaxID=2936508 RepID=UPI00200F1121|nr:Wzz/FepE/Etk N-terminal domain-containing protein [Paenibacillus hamazuiensis]